MKKYHGIVPAFYACYDDSGEVSPERVRVLARHLLDKDVNGLYVGGSSGECIYQSVQDRMTTLEHVMETVNGKIPVIAHVACNNTRDSRMLAEHAQSLGVDAVAAIPPIYFHLPEYGIAKYWNDISDAAPDTDFIIYNIPQLAGTALTPALLREMKKNPRLRGVKNSSAAASDIQRFKEILGEGGVVFNGPDEQYISGRVIGADAGIGGTYGAMPELFLMAEKALCSGNIERATAIQNDISQIIRLLHSGHGSIYAVIKAVLLEEGVNIGGVRSPLTDVDESDRETVKNAYGMIRAAIAKYSV